MIAAGCGGRPTLSPPGFALHGFSLQHLLGVRVLHPGHNGEIIHIHRWPAFELNWLFYAHYRGNIPSMVLAQSKVTAQGQISVPAEVRRKLGVGPGSVLEWEEDGEKIIVRRKGRYSSEDLHRALFPRKAPKPRTLDEMRDGIRRHVRERHARS